MQQQFGLNGPIGSNQTDGLGQPSQAYSSMFANGNPMMRMPNRQGYNPNNMPFHHMNKRNFYFNSQNKFNNNNNNSSYYNQQFNQNKMFASSQVNISINPMANGNGAALVGSQTASGQANEVFFEETNIEVANAEIENEEEDVDDDLGLEEEDTYNEDEGYALIEQAELKYSPDLNIENVEQKILSMIGLPNSYLKQSECLNEIRNDLISSSGPSKTFSLYNLVCNRSLNNFSCVGNEKLKLVDCVGLDVGSFLKKDLSKRADLASAACESDGAEMRNNLFSNVFSSCVNLLGSENLLGMPKCCEGLI